MGESLDFPPDRAVFYESHSITPWITNMGLQNAFIVAGFAGMAQILTVFLFIQYGQSLRQASSGKYHRYKEEMVAAGLVY